MSTLTKNANKFKQSSEYYDQLERLENLSVDQVFEECKISTQTCLKLKERYEELCQELNDIEDLRFQSGGLGAFAYSVYILLGFRWNLIRKQQKTSTKLETAKQIDTLNWSVYSQKKKDAESKEIELGKE